MTDRISVQKTSMPPRLLVSGLQSVAIVEVGDCEGGAVWVGSVRMSFKCLWDSQLEVISGHLNLEV